MSTGAACNTSGIEMFGINNPLSLAETFSASESSRAVELFPILTCENSNTGKKKMVE